MHLRKNQKRMLQMMNFYRSQLSLMTRRIDYSRMFKGEENLKMIKKDKQCRSHTMIKMTMMMSLTMLRMKKLRIKNMVEEHPIWFPRLQELVPSLVRLFQAHMQIVRKVETEDQETKEASSRMTKAK